MNVAKVGPVDVVTLQLTLTRAEVEKIHKEYYQLDSSKYPALNELAERVDYETVDWS